MANLMGWPMLILTQPFAQGDWVTLEDLQVDGWVERIGVYHTLVQQPDKRPVYVPNSKLLVSKIRNNSRMTNRRILLTLPLRTADIPKIPQIAQEIQEMINEHEDIDPKQHRLARFRDIEVSSAQIWISCFGLESLEADGRAPLESSGAELLHSKPIPQSGPDA